MTLDRGTGVQRVALSLFAAMLLSCARPATAVLFVVDTNAPQERSFTMRVTASGAADAAQGTTFSVTRGVNSVVFPASFTVRAGGRAEGTVLIEATLASASASQPALQFRRSARFSFTQGRVTWVRVYLPVECATAAVGCRDPLAPCTAAVLCEERGLTCGDDGACVSPEVVPEVVEGDVAQVVPRDVVQQSDGPVAMDAAMDAVTDASLDAVVRDAAADVVGEDAAPPMCDGSQQACGSECVTLADDPMHCGMCGRACPVPPHARATCLGGATCRYVCDAGFRDCDGEMSNGCEAELDRDPDHCGGCLPCARYQNMLVACVTGTCAYGCAAGSANCDGTTINGCEVNSLRTARCGGCSGSACTGTTPYCNGGTCSTGCSAGATSCSGECVNTQSSTFHCGACGNACSTSHAISTCVSGRCRLDCATGYGNCNGDVADGCETDLNTATLNCGTCGRICFSPQSCLSGSCR